MQGGAILPLNTFFNVSESKRDLIISASIEEFSTNSYNSASINNICKKSNIAKGSFYQYFTDKLDLYVYIMRLAIEEKIKFFSSVLNEFDSLSLIEKFRLLFIKGAEFAQLNPQYAALGRQFSVENDKKVISAVNSEGEKQSESLFIYMIDNAKSKGEISENVDTIAFNMLLLSLNHTINEYMLKKFGVISYEDFEEEVNSFIDSLLYIISKGIEKA